MDAAPLAACGAPPSGRAVWLRTTDGVRLRVAHWPGARHLLILPGRTEFIEKYGPLVSDLAAAGWGAVVVDWRGQGRSDRLLADPHRGHVGDFMEYQRDLDAVRGWMGAQMPGLVPVIAHSMAGAIALRALAGGWQVPAMALAAPMLNLPLPRIRRLAVRVMAALGHPFGWDRAYAAGTGPGFGLATATFARNRLTTDPAQFDRMKRQIADRGLHVGGPSLRWTAAALSECRALAALPAPDVPVLIGLGGQDQVIDQGAIRQLAARWSRAGLAVYPDARHELLMERAPVREDFLHRALALFAAQTG